MRAENQKRSRGGFTLIELVVVVLVMGILAAVAAPKMFDTATNAKLNSARQSLSVLRDAIELYKAQNGTYPGQTGTGTALATDLKPFLKGPFPTIAIAGFKKDGTVKYATPVGSPDGATDWVYDKADGTIIMNLTGYETN
jgi:general secretion pathway protein G